MSTGRGWNQVRTRFVKCGYKKKQNCMELFFQIPEFCPSMVSGKGFKLKTIFVRQRLHIII